MKTQARLRLIPELCLSLVTSLVHSFPGLYQLLIIMQVLFSLYLVLILTGYRQDVKALVSTRVIPSFYGLTEASLPCSYQLVAGAVNHCLRHTACELTNLFENVIGSIYWSTAVGSSKNRTTFVNTLLNVVKKYDLDGLDFE